MIFNSPYDTTFGKIVNTERIEHAIQVGMVSSSIDKMTLNVRPTASHRSFFITGLDSTEDDIALFAHPLVFDYKNSSYVVTDARFFVDVKEARVSGVENSIRNKVEYNFAKSRNILTLAWLSGDIGHIKNGLKFARGVFAGFIAQTISRLNALDPGDQLRIQIVANYYYNSLFHKGTEIDAETRESWVSHTIENTRADYRVVSGIFQELGPMNNIEDFCTNVVKVCQNSRLNDFSHLALVTMLRNTWYGVNAKEVISVAIEHPPTWVAMVYAAIQERTFKNSPLAKQADIMNRNNSGKEFIESYGDIVRQYLDGRTAMENMNVRSMLSVGDCVPDFN